MTLQLFFGLQHGVLVIRQQNRVRNNACCNEYVEVVVHADVEEKQVNLVVLGSFWGVHKLLLLLAGLFNRLVELITHFSSFTVRSMFFFAITLEAPYVSHRLFLLEFGQRQLPQTFFFLLHLLLKFCSSRSCLCLICWFL